METNTLSDVKTKDVLALMYNKPLPYFERKKTSWWEVDVEKNGSGYQVVNFFPQFSVFHWLLEVVRFDPDMDQTLQAYVKECEDKFLLTIEMIDNFPSFLKQNGKNGEYVTGIDGEEKIPTEGSFTGDYQSVLDRQFYFNAFEVDSLQYAIIGACPYEGARRNDRSIEVPRAFRIFDEPIYIWDVAKVDVIASPSERETAEIRRQLLMPSVDLDPVAPIRWYSYDGGDEYSVEDSGGRSNVKDLRDYELTTDPTKRGKGSIYVNRVEKKLHCPVTGWELVPYFF